MATYYRWDVYNTVPYIYEGSPSNYTMTGSGPFNTFYMSNDTDLNGNSIDLVAPSVVQIKSTGSGSYNFYYAIEKTGNSYVLKATGTENRQIIPDYDSQNVSWYKFSRVTVQRKKDGSRIRYAYSTNPSAYPNDGVSGSYHYEQRTTIISPTAPAGITYPATITTPSVTLSWTAATSATGYPVNQYEVSYSTNGGTSWTVVGTTASTSYSVGIPAGTTSVMFRVRARDTNNQYGDYVTGTASQVLIAPTLTVPQMVMQGQQATIKWTAVDGADSYTLQRKSSADADWTQVYSGTGLSYTETVGTWTSLQYRVQAVFGDTPGGWATSGEIQIVSASALVISGSDGDLGTLTNDVQYSVSSDGSNALTVTESVNGTEIRTFTATNGGTNTISVVDLPTGYGTITITATTTATGGAVSVTRNWTYTKTAPVFGNTGSVADLVQQAQIIWAKTIAEAVRVPGIWGGNLGLALQLLSKAVLYDPETGNFEGIGGEDAAIPVPQIETGSYVGTGTYAGNNYNQLTFSGRPMVVFVQKELDSQDYQAYMINGSRLCVVDPTASRTCNVTWEGNSVKWISSYSAQIQLNTSGTKYVYKALTLSGDDAS